MIGFLIKPFWGNDPFIQHCPQGLEGLIYVITSPRRKLRPRKIKKLGPVCKAHQVVDLGFQSRKCDPRAAVLSGREGVVAKYGEGI